MAVDVDVRLRNYSLHIHSKKADSGIDTLTTVNCPTSSSAMIYRRSFVIGALAGLPGLTIGMAMVLGAEARLDQAEQFVREMVDTAIPILKLPERAKAEREAGIRRLFDSHFDLPTITRLVLGRYWRKASPDQKRGFAKVVKTHIVKVYNTQLGHYEDQIVDIKKVTPLNETDTVIFTENRARGRPAAANRLACTQQ